MGLYITNFSIPEKVATYCTSPLNISVDVLDDIYDVTLSGTYITCNDKNVPFDTTVISGGYNLLYSTTPSGNLDIRVFASNNNGDLLEKLYYFQYGYEVTWEKVSVWSPGKEIPIAVIATNEVVKPNTAYFSTFFRTTAYREFNLEAFISVEGSGQYNIPAEIRPQSKYFMYGKTYSVTISGVKDFRSNVLDPVTFTFTIEDKIIDNGNTN
jgi:hypothetical protein